MRSAVELGPGCWWALGRSSRAGLPAGSVAVVAVGTVVWLVLRGSDELGQAAWPLPCHRGAGKHFRDAPWVMSTLH